MSKYRIVKVTRHPYWLNSEEYMVQKRFLGFLWWYNFDIDSYLGGVFDTYEKAEQRILAEMTKDKYEVVKTW